MYIYILTCIFIIDGIFMLSGMILFSIFLGKYRNKVSFLLDEYGFTELADEISYILRKTASYERLFFTWEDTKLYDKVWSDFSKLKLNKSHGLLYKIQKLYRLALFSFACAGIMIGMFLFCFFIVII